MVAKVKDSDKDAEPMAKTDVGEPDEQTEVALTGDGQADTRIHWDDSDMTENYANVATVIATQEEFSILFGVQKGLRPDPRGMTVQVSNRIMVNPFLAKRLLAVLTRTLDEYERRFGAVGGQD